MTEMGNLNEICRAVRFIEEHLTEPLMVKDVADAAGYSLYHFSRTFNRMLGHSPYDYIMRRRLSEAAHLLMDSNRKIIDIALTFQFNNPETFSRAFRKMFGILPNQARKNGYLHPLQFKSQSTPEHILHINQNEFQKPRIVKRNELLLVGLATHTANDPLLMIELQNQLDGEEMSIRKRTQSLTRYAISVFPANRSPNGFFHFAGMAVHSFDDIPEPMVAKRIPANSWVEFIHKGRLEDMDMTRDYIFQTWMPKSGIQLSTTMELMTAHTSFPDPDNPSSEFNIGIPIA